MTNLFGIAASSGTPRPIAEAVGIVHPDMDKETADWTTDPARREAVRLLEEDGFRDFVVSDLGVVELAKQAMASSLKETGLDPEEIDAVIFVTESFRDHSGSGVVGAHDQLALRNDFLRALGALGMNSACPYGNWLSGCANVGASLILARALLNAGQHRRIMLVAADRTPAWEPRLMHNGAAVYSDVATSCVLGVEPRGYRIEQAVSVAAPRIAGFDYADKNDLGKVVYETLKSLRRLGRTFTEVSGRRPGDFKTVLGGHFHKLSLRVVTDSLGISGDHVRRDARSHYGHAYASDNLLTLLEIERAEGIGAGQQILLLNTGIWVWSLILLERCPGN